MTPNFSVLHVAACPFPASRGTPVRILRLAEAIHSLGHRVEVVTYHLGDSEQGLPFPVHRIAPIAFYNKMNPGPTYAKLLVVDFMLMLKVFDLARQNRYDVIHAHHYEGLLAALPAHFLLNIPVVFDSHTLLQTELPYYKLFLPDWFKRKVGELFDRFFPVFADHIICVSDQQHLVYSSYLGTNSSRFSMVPNGVEVEHFAAGRAEPVPAGQLTLGYAGNLASFQGIDLMLDATSRLVDEFPNLMLNIYTNDAPDAYQSWLSLPALAGKVHFFPSDFMTLPHQLAQADLLLSPRPKGDGYPIKLMNYMAASKPIVCFSAASHDLVHGESGWLVENITPEEYAQAIRHLLLNPGLREEIGRNARELVEQEFSWERRARQVDQIYQKQVKT